MKASTKTTFFSNILGNKKIILQLFPKIREIFFHIIFEILKLIFILSLKAYNEHETDNSTTWHVLTGHAQHDSKLFQLFLLLSNIKLKNISNCVHHFYHEKLLSSL